MQLELKKRILTSIIIFPIFLVILIYSKVFLIIFLILFYLLSSYEILKNSKGLLFKIIANLILLCSFYSFYYLSSDNLHSLIILCWIIFSTILSDIGGYVIGKTFKGKKLTRISPNKTISGSLGSFIFSIFSIPILFYFQIIFFSELAINFFHYKFLIFTILISFIAQLGDIYVSYWKRKFNIKDTGNFLPGHGGVLDRIDGMIFVIIFFGLANYLGYF